MRRKDWRTRLHAYIESVRRATFRWSRMDCAIFVAGCVEAMTGEDLAALYRGRYATIEEGLALVQADGFSDYVDVFRQRYEEIVPAMARVGDVAVVPGDEGLTLGIVGGARIFLSGERGIVTRPLTDAVTAFRV